MRGQGEYIAAVVLTMIIVSIAILATNWARYIEDMGRMQVVNIVKSKERLTIIWPYEDDRNKILIVNQWDGNSEIKGFLIVYKQQLFVKIINTSFYNNMDLSITSIKIMDLRDLGLNSSELMDISRVCIITSFSNIFCNEYIPMKTVLPEGISFVVPSSPIRIYISSYDVIAPIISHGFVTISGYLTNQPNVVYFVRPFLPKIPVALVYSDNKGYYYADAGRKNFTVIIQYNNGSPSLVSAYLDNNPYIPQQFYSIGTLLIIDGIPFRVLQGYTGIAIYQAHIYYAYVISNKTLYRVYSLSYPTKLNPMDLNIFIAMVRSSISTSTTIISGIQNVIPNFPIGVITGSRDFVNMTPVILGNYTMLSDGSLKLTTLLTPMADTWKVSSTFRSIYPDGPPWYKLLKDVSSKNIVMSRNILYMPIVKTASATTNRIYNVVAIWRDVFDNTFGDMVIQLIPIGQGVWGNVVELNYTRIVGDLAQIRLTANGNIRFNPIQWIFIDWMNQIIKNFVSRYTLYTVMLNPDRITGYIVDALGHYATTTVYTCGGIIYRTPLAYTTARTTIFTPPLYIVMTTNPASRVINNQDWISIFFADGGIMWIDHEYIDDRYPVYTKYLYKYPYMLAWQTPYLPPTLSAITSISISVPPPPPPEDIIGILAVPTSGGEPWAQDIYLAYYQGRSTFVNISYSIEKWVFNGQSWSPLTESFKTINIGWGERYKIGSMPNDNYYWWVIKYSVNGGSIQQVAIGNFRTPPKILITTTTITTTVIGIYTITITITSTSTSYIPPPGWERPIYFNIYYQDIPYITCMFIVLFIAIMKIWKRLDKN